MVSAVDVAFSSCFAAFVRPNVPITGAQDIGSNQKTARQAWPFQTKVHKMRRTVTKRSSLRCGRQRNGAIGQRPQVGDHVGALAVLLDAGKAHRGAGNEALRIGDERVEVVVGPGAALALHGGGEIEATALALVVAD